MTDTQENTNVKNNKLTTITREITGTINEPLRTPSIWVYRNSAHPLEIGKENIKNYGN